MRAKPMRGTNMREEIMVDDADFDPPKVYTYKGKGKIPRNATIVVVHYTVKEIPAFLFSGCKWLKIVLLCDGLLRIRRCAFRGCTSLRSVRCLSTIKKITWGSFAGCDDFSSVQLPEGLKAIEDRTFSGCTSLEAIRIPSSVTWIGEYAFIRCINLASIELPEGMRWIGNNAFEGCRSLRKVCFPSLLECVGNFGFCGCRNLRLVLLHKNLPVLGWFVFEQCPAMNFRFAGLSKRAEAIRMDDRTRSTFNRRLRGISRAMSIVVAEAHDFDWEEGLDECRKGLERAHEFLTHLELKESAAVLELALWKARIEGEGGEGSGEDTVKEKDEEWGTSVASRGSFKQSLLRLLWPRERKRPKATKNIDPPLPTRERCRYKCGSAVVIPNVMEFFPFSPSLPRLDYEAPFERTGMIMAWWQSLVGST